MRWPLTYFGLIVMVTAGGLVLRADEPKLDKAILSRIALSTGQKRAVGLLQQLRPDKPQRLFLFTDPNKDPDDLSVLIEIKYLQAAGFVDLRCVVTSLGTRNIRTTRAQFARCVLEDLGLENTRVGVGIDYEIEVKAADGAVDVVATAGREKDHCVFMDTPLLRPLAPVEPEGLAMIQNELESLPDHSVVFLINSGMADPAALLRNSPDLLQRKLLKVVIMGGVESQLDSQGFVVADKRAYNNSMHQPSADYTYSKFQELRVPLVIVVKEAAYSVAVPRSFYDGIAATNHPVGVYLKNQQQQALKNLWTGICNGHLPPALTPDWFFRTFTKVDCDSPAGKIAISEARAASENFDAIWNQVSKFNLYDPLALLAATPGAAELLFDMRVPIACQFDVKIIDKDSIKDATVMRDLLSGMGIESLNPPQPVKSRTQIARGYPPRQPVDESVAPWALPLANYFPPEFTAGVVFQNEGKWADPRDVREVKREFLTLSHGPEVPARIDALGRPLNPLGRTGIQGRGLLGRWGRNLAGDPLVTRVAPASGQLQLLVIERKDSGQKALPGGMVDEGEDIATTVARELLEETGAKLDFETAATLYAGVVDDPRNTDNAWMETTVLHKHLTAAEQNELKLRAGDDASAVHWADVSNELLSSMYASHADYVRLALSHLRNDPTIAKQLSALLAD